MGNIYYTYAYLRQDGTPYYIGKGKNRRAWVKNHRRTVMPLDRSRILILKKNLTEEEAFKHEAYMIALYGRKDIGTGILWNFTDGGEGTSGVNRSAEWRAKVSSSKKGKERSEDTKAKISAANKGNKHSEDTKAKISAARKGKKHSEESKAKMSAVQKQRSDETRAKLSAALKGKERSEEHKAKISAANKGKKHSEEAKAKISATLMDYHRAKKLQ